MSSTRYRAEGSEPRDERFASHPSLTKMKALKTCDVVRRCETFRDPRHVELALFLQWMSGRKDGWENLLNDLADIFPDRIGYWEINGFVVCPQYRNNFIKETGAEFREFCLNPDQDYIDSRCFRDILNALLEYMDIWETKTLKILFTKVGSSVIDSLNYAEQVRCATLVQGSSRIGKTYIAEKWCEARPGRRRIVSLDEANDQKSFFKQIAVSIGCASNNGLKVTELRSQVNDALQSGYFTFVIDEAHFLWPQANYKDTSPKRIEWVRAALLNKKVPVAMIATEQFLKSQSILEKRTSWNGDQLRGRVAYAKQLFDKLSQEDLESISRHFLPECDESAIRYVANYARVSNTNIAAIEHLVGAARHEAARNGRSLCVEDLVTARKNYMVPCDNLLGNVSDQPTNVIEKKPCKTFAVGVQPARKTLSAPSEPSQVHGETCNSGLGIDRTESVSPLLSQ